MFNSKIFKIVVIGLSFLFSGNALSATLEDLVEARQGIMKLYAVNLDYLGDMLRERIPYNKKAAQDAADNLMALATFKSYTLWPEGSGMDNPQLRGKTWTKPELWQNKAEVSALQQELIKALEVTVYNAAWSLDGIQESLKDVNGVCNGCHKKYMAEK
ncbi:MAG: cytochrome c [Gammaproteobacteria bacterium]|nr:cytochrome c [Gammaproteobacteria bacterium]